MRDRQAVAVDEVARRSPTALVMALERAILRGDRPLERAVLRALGEIGIVVVDRPRLADALAVGGPSA